MADGQQGISISSGFTLSEDDFIDKDFIQSTLANALANIAIERRYNGKPIYVLEPANRGLYFMNIAKDGFIKIGSVAQSNLTAIIPPTVNNDETEGYDIGSLWLDTAANEYYRCADASFGAAVWPLTTLTADELATVAVSGQYSDLLGLPNLSPAGADKQVQFNDGGVYGIDALFSYDKASKTLLIGPSGGQAAQLREGTMTLFDAAGQIIVSLQANPTGGIMLINGDDGSATIDAAPGNDFIFKLDSTTKGFLKPRMTTIQRVALGVLLGLGDEGMEVYDLDTLSSHTWDGTQWVEAGSGGGGATLEERVMFDSNLDTVREIYYNSVLTIGAFSIDTVRIATLEFETSTDGVTWTSHGTIAASGTPPAALQTWIDTNGSGNWYLRLSVVYKAGQTLATGTQWTFTR